MSGKTITKDSLSKAISETLKRDPQIRGGTKQDSRKILEDVLTHISDALVRGEDAKISSFGSFLLREKPPVSGAIPAILTRYTKSVPVVLWCSDPPPKRKNVSGLELGNKLSAVPSSSALDVPCRDRPVLASGPSIWQEGGSAACPPGGS